MLTYVLLGYLALLALLALARTAPIKSPVVQRLRAFFPSWRFFEDLGDVPVLLGRSGPSEAGLGPWVPLLPPVRRRWTQLFYNPEGNLALAFGSLVQQLVSDAADHETGDFATSVSYRLAHELVRRQLGPVTCFQWKVVAGADDVLVSPVYAVG
jgi:hypothetical protein